VLNQLLSNRVIKTPSTEVSADRYEFLALSEAEPDLGIPAGNSYILASTTTGTRSWINPATASPAPGSNTQVVFNNAGVLAGASGLVYDTATGRVGIGVASPTAELELAETWNNAGTIFTHIKSNVTDTASNAASLLIDLQVGESSKFKVDKEGRLLVPAINPKVSLAIGDYTTGFGNYSNGGIDIATSGVNRVRIRGGEFRLSSDTILGFSSGDPTAAGADLTIHRDAANTLAQRRGTTAQTSRIYNTYTDASNYERAKIGWNTNVLEIGTENAGTSTFLRNINLIGGAVGIGIAAPGTSLDVQGGYGNGVRIRGPVADNNWYGGIQLTNSTAAAAGALISSSTNGIFFTYGGSERVRINASGNVGINTTSPSARLDVVGDIEVNSNVNLNSEATTLATVTKTQIASFAVASFRSGKLIVQAYDSISGEVQISELLVAHNGTTASATEYGVVYTGSTSIVNYDVDILSGNVRLMATRTTTNSTQYKISETLMVA